ncbi:MAG TPA: SCP2 sterol-binding domain-containing protein [Myxococcota bacterium]|jgi:putative sterol carrier protein|nr:SCP2 sterol-binding domain-containing protein [Myxococcota bacterium]
MADLTPKDVFSTRIPNMLKENPARAAEVNAVYQFIITGDTGGTWVVDLKAEGGGKVSEGPRPDAQCTIECKDSDFIAIVTGKMPGPQAFMMGKLKIKGDMSLAMKLGKVLGS